MVYFSNPFWYTFHLLYTILKIEGSIRKWYLGNTLDDLSRSEYKDSWEFVFDLLNIPYETMKHFNIVRVEIGQNVSVRKPCYVIEKGIIGYKSNCYKDKSTKGEGRKFKSKHFSLKLYNKVEEIIAPFKNKRILSNEELDVLTRYKDKDELRVEFTISGGKTRIHDKLGYCSLKDSIDNFEEMYSFFWNSLLLLQFDKTWGCTPEFNPNGKQLRELMMYLTLLGIHQCSLESIEAWAKKMKHGRQVIYSIKKLMRGNPYTNTTYNEKEFYKDIKIQLIRSMQKSKCLKGNVKRTFQPKFSA